MWIKLNVGMYILSVDHVLLWLWNVNIAVIKNGCTTKTFYILYVLNIKGLLSIHAVQFTIVMNLFSCKIIKIKLPKLNK